MHLGKRVITAVLRSADYRLVRYSRFEEYLRYAAESRQAAHDIEFLQTIPSPELLRKALEYLPQSRSQLRQDLFVLSQLNFKPKGFFVEFGATNGVDLSNTYLLESSFGWTGVLAEPGRGWHDTLVANRSVEIDTRCVWKDSGVTLSFKEAVQREFSTISSFSNADNNGDMRKRGVEYRVSTVSLMDLLNEHNAPAIVDYLSIDTEGSEFDIIEPFDFTKYRFRVITCEHNYTYNRERIFELLTSNGYSRVLHEISQFDDWYVWNGD